MRIKAALASAAACLLAVGIPALADGAPSDRLVAASRLQDAGNHREAIALLEQIREVDPENPQVIYGLALSLHAVGEFREAAHVGETLLAEDKTAPADLYAIVGNSYARLADWAQAEAVLRTGINAWPESTSLRVQHALSLEGLNRVDDAVAEIEQCLEREPYTAAAWRALGDALSATGAPGRAFAAYVRSSTLESDDARAKDAAAEAWHVLFQGAAGASDSDVAEKAEAKGLAMVAALRHDPSWSKASDARFFAYAMDTSLRLVSALHAKGTTDVFWRPFVLDYFDEIRNAGHMEALAYTVREAGGDPDAARWCAVNSAKVDAFKTWSERWAVRRPDMAEKHGNSD